MLNRPFSPARTVPGHVPWQAPQKSTESAGLSLPGLNMTSGACSPPAVVRKKSVRDEFVGENLRETLDCSHWHTRGMLPAL